MKEKYKGNLISGTPITLDNVGKVFPLTLREIFEIGEEKYNKMIVLLTIDIDSLNKTREVKIEENTTEFELLMANCFHSQEFKNELEESFQTIFKEKIEVYPKEFAIVVGGIEDGRYITEDNLFELSNIVRLQNLHEIKEKKKKTVKKLNKKADLLRKKQKSGRELLSRAKGEDKVSLGDLLSNMGVYTKNINSSLDMTIYQFYNQYEKFLKEESHKNNFDMFLVGVDPKQLGLDKHWTSNNK